MSDFRDIFHKSMYTKMALEEINNLRKYKRTGTLVGCCKCGRTNRTLYKCDEGYICKVCKEEEDGNQ